jgi:hypothetical protein
VKPRSRGVPAREWLALIFPPTCAAILLAASFAAVLGEPTGEWIALLSAFAAGLASSGLYTLWLARRGRLFLRDDVAVAVNRARIETVGIPVGWALGGAVLVVALIVGDSARVVLMCVGAGLLLGFWPGLLANFLRLRRAGWPAADGGSSGYDR